MQLGEIVGRILSSKKFVEAERAKNAPARRGEASVIPSARQVQPDFLIGNGEMGERIRALDWSQTPLGRIENWPQSLKTAVQIMLDSRYPMFVWWGAELTNLYNDYHVAVHGNRHPLALGQSARDVWTEVWAILGPQTETVLREGRSTWNEEILLPLERNGYPEETYFTFSYSPVRGPDGTVQGLFGVCTEDTSRVVARRRLKILRDLGERTLQESKTVERAVTAATRTLGDNPLDIPFALVYLLDHDGCTANFAAAAPRELPPVPREVRLGVDNDIFSFSSVLKTTATGTIDNFDIVLGGFAGEAWPEAIERAAVVPLAKTGIEGIPAGFLVAGVSPRLKFDDDYRSFLGLAGGQIATAIANARAYEEERKRAEALAELDRAKTAFFSNVSHEFRTPLTLLLGPLESVLAKQDAIPSSERAQLETAHRSSLRLLKLVNSLLDFSRIEAGRVTARYEPVELASFTADLASNFRSAMEAGGLQFNVDCPALPQPVYVDREMWEKIVLNLLSNAFKFTFEGCVSVKLKSDNNEAILTVADTGVGIPEGELPHIFERFHRVENARGRTYEGTGIGLALIQELAKLHGGNVQVQSRLGEGSTFKVSIPFGTKHLPSDRVSAISGNQPSTAVRAQPFTAEALTWVATEARTRPIEDLPVDSGENVAYRPRVLLADDNSDMREHISHLLGSRYDIVAVSNGSAALEEARRTPPDLVLSDVMMPGLNGFELLKELRADVRLREVPVILLSARAGEEARVDGINAGANDYLIKPFSARELFARVSTTLRLATIRREYEQRLEADLEAVTRLNDVGRRCIRTGNDFEGNLKEILATAIWITGGDKGNIRLLDAGSGALKIAAQSGFEESFLAFFDTAIEEEPGGAALRSGERIIVEDVTQSAIFVRQPGLKVLLDAGVRAVQSTSLISSSGRTFGMISTHFSQPHRPSERDLRLLDLLALQAADYLERLEIEKELRNVNADLEQFAYSASHDLQEPLRTVKIFSELLAGKYREKLDGQAREYLDNVKSGATRMEGLVRDLLSYTQVSRFERPVEPEDAKDALDGALVNLGGAIAESGAKIDSDPLPSLPVHHIQLQQLFQNLIGNAIKYRTPGVAPVVHIATKQQNGTYLFSVSDNGIGIEAQYRERIFGLFKRLHAADRYSGTGVGLAICQRIVDGYHGRIWVESEPGKGSTFFFTLPV
jgi:signal transduction histidine kinase